jgi:hypothetical protein
MNPYRKEVNLMPRMTKLSKSLKDPKFATAFRKDPVGAMEASLGRPLTDAEKEGVKTLKVEHLRKIVAALQPHTPGARMRPD